MKILLKRSTTGEYRGRNKTWTNQIEDAVDFHSTSRALSQAIILEEDGLEIIMSFDDQRYDMRLRCKLRYTVPPPRL